MKKSTNGFTIVELLIVILVIAILAAISVVAFNGVQNRAVDAAIRADLANVAKKLETARTDYNRYPANISELPTDIKFTKAVYNLERNNAYLCINTVQDTYAFTIAGKNGKSYALTSGGGSSIQVVASNNGNTTCALINATWGASDTYVRQFYGGSTKVWAVPWDK